MTSIALTLDDQALVDAARAALAHAFAPFSHFHVGAALRLVDGSIVSGCNIENATFGLTMCAERVALFTAIAGGARPGDFVTVAVVATAARPTPPCGACRQLLWEFCGDVPVLCVADAGAVTSVRVSELLPMPFDLSFLPETNDK
jgi:cytidine deaminase